MSAWQVVSDHPWMVFWLLVIAMMLVNDSIADICNSRIAVSKAKAISALKDAAKEHTGGRA